jgi:hypothetical protein
MKIQDGIIKIGLKKDLYEYYKSFVKEVSSDTIGDFYELPELTIDKQFESIPDDGGGLHMIFFFEVLEPYDDPNVINKRFNKQYLHVLKGNE